MSDFPYGEIDSAFAGAGAAAGIEALINVARNSADHHALFRALLLKKRHELGLPLVNPGDLKDAPADTRRAYEDFVEAACREVGTLYLNEGDIVQAWRYFRTIGESDPVRQALEKLDAKDASDEILGIALDQGVAPVRGFDMVLQRHGLCRAITTFDAGFTNSIEDKYRAAELLCRALYRVLVLAVRKQIYARFNEYPPETDLVELVRHRPWLFESGHAHTDPTHVAAVARIGLLAEANDARLMALSICEYGRLLKTELRPEGQPPFEAGFDDYARYARALLGENVEATIEHFRAKLNGYDLPNMESFAAEMVLLLLWRCGRQDDALTLWQHSLSHHPPEMPGIFIPSFYELCIKTGALDKLAATAREQGDAVAWAAALASASAGR